MKFSSLLPLLLLLFTTTATITQAQQFGGNPPSIKWNQINTPVAKIIFPTGLDSAALRVANIVQQMNGVIQPTIGFKQRQISIVLQNQTTIANAYVGLAPFRSEFYLTPDQNSFEIGSLWWPEQLAVHEFRHVQQYNNFNVGFSHTLKIFFGEGGQALGNALAIPNWFFEGDAVFNETHVSEQGRGRLPYFFNGYRAIWAANKDYSYMKLRNGSYRDYTPDWYPLGYMLVSYGREKYGDDFWKNVTHDAAAFNGVFFPFQKAVKKYSGESFERFSTDGMDYFRKQFNEHRMDNPDFGLPQHFVANREYPAFVNDSTLIYMKSTYNHLPAFTIKTGYTEKKISTRSISLDNYFAYRDGKIVYSSYSPDLRWNYRDYSELIILDVKTGREHRITRHTKYFSPAFSPDGKTIVTVMEGAKGECELHLLNAGNGKLISVVPNKSNLFYTYPKFYGNNKIISAVRKKGEMSLAEIDIKTGDTRYLLPFSYRPIGFPVIKDDTVYFTETLGIDDRLFALNIKTGQLRVMDDVGRRLGEIGCYQPAVGNKKIAWVWFAAEGYTIDEANLAYVKWKVIDNTENLGNLPDFSISALARDSSAGLLPKIKNDTLPITKYHKSHHLFNFHSLVPNFNDPNYAISLEGENVLNTMQTQLSFNYNRDEGFKEFGADAIYGPLFPYIKAGADYTVDRRGYYKGNNIYWNETNLHGGLELPLNFTQGKHATSLYIGSDLYYAQSVFQQAYRSMFADRNYTYSNNYIMFSNSIQRARQNIYPRLAQSISLNYKSAIAGVEASQFLVNGSFYFPGLLVNHNLVINLAHQQKNKNNEISFSNDFPFARGYQAENLDNMNKAGVNYHFPISYPDAGLANTVYLLRVRGNVFYDYTRARDFYDDVHAFKGTFRSTGAEVYFDTQLFNEGSVSFGFRYSYLIDQDAFGGTGRNRFEIIVPITVF